VNLHTPRRLFWIFVGLLVYTALSQKYEFRLSDISAYLNVNRNIIHHLSSGEVFMEIKCYAAKPLLLVQTATSL